MDKDGTTIIIFICITAGIIGVWATLLFETNKKNFNPILVGISFIMHSVFSIASGGIATICSIAYVHKITLLGDIRTKIYLSILAVLLNLIGIRGLNKRIPSAEQNFSVSEGNH